MAAAHIEVGRRAKSSRRRGIEPTATSCSTGTGAVRSARSTSSPAAAVSLVVVEVKTRRTDAFGVPALAVTPVEAAAPPPARRAWLAEHRIGRRVEVRFDVASVVGDVVTIYERAFE